MEMQSVRVRYNIASVPFPLHVFFKSVLQSIEDLWGTFREPAMSNETGTVNSLWLLICKTRARNGVKCAQNPKPWSRFWPVAGCK